MANIKLIDAALLWWVYLTGSGDLIFSERENNMKMGTIII
jgi:hypothetical protein